jgi:hypothetical protein
MKTEALEAAEALSAKGAVAPRVSVQDIENSIDHAFYVTAAEAVSGIPNREPGFIPPSLEILTLCILVMANGWVVIGKSAPASPENFDPEKGQKFAYEDAVRQLWPLMGFALKERLQTQELREEIEPFDGDGDGHPGGSKKKDKEEAEPA